MFRIKYVRLLELRKERGLRVDDVAQAIGIDKRTISSWEGGDVNDFYFNKFAALADFYEVDIMSLLEKVAPTSAQFQAQAVAP